MPVKININMPKSCAVCGFCNYNDGEGFAEDYYNCVINGQFLGIEPSSTKRHQQCPLQEVKEREDMKFAWLPEGADRRYCLFLIKEDGFKIKIKDPKYEED